jgi:hypothetical protein
VADLATLPAAALPARLAGGLDPSSDCLPFLSREPLGRFGFGLIEGQSTRTSEVIFSTPAGIDILLLPSSLAGLLSDARRQVWTTDVVRTVAQNTHSIPSFLLVQEAVEVDEDHVPVLRVEYCRSRQLRQQVNRPPLARAWMPNPSNLCSAPLARSIWRYGSIGRDVVSDHVSRQAKCGRSLLEWRNKIGDVSRP